jgi:hypothetical protein
MSNPPPYGNPQGDYPGGSSYPPPPGGYTGGGYANQPPRRSGYVPQVTVVAILMIVQGSLVSLAGMFFLFLGPAMFLNRSSHPAQDQQIVNVIGGINILLGGLLVGVGGLNIVAGIKNLKYRGRTLGITALSLGVAGIFGCYCAPTAIGLLIYGLIIYLNQDVSRAFVMGEQGATPEQIKNAI